MSKRILALDTTAEYGSISLGGEEILLHSPEGFGGVIFDHIADLLKRVDLRLEDVDAFAAASGPGSFTGVRIGLACVKGLAEANGKPAFGISNLAALATFGTTAHRVPVIDARRGEVFASCNGEEVVCPVSVLLTRLPAPPVEFITQDFALPLDGTPYAGSQITKAPKALASAIARIAAERLQAGESGEPAALDANYVRRSDAEIFFKPW